MANDRYGEPIDEAAPAATVPAHAWENVPANTARGFCIGHTKPGGSCRAEVFWISRPKMRKGKPVKGTVRVPVDCDVAGGVRPSRELDGKGVNHYTTCPDARQFKR